MIRDFGNQFEGNGNYHWKGKKWDSDLGKSPINLPPPELLKIKSLGDLPDFVQGELAELFESLSHMINKRFEDKIKEVSSDERDALYLAVIMEHLAYTLMVAQNQGKMVRQLMAKIVELEDKLDD
mgnify:CR=1 FL=1